MEGQRVGASLPEVDVADVQEPARVRPTGQSLLAHMQGPAESHLQRSMHRTSL
jgi:hypothetical protein